MNEFPIDLIQYCIFNLLDLRSQLNLRLVSRRLNRLKIYDLLNIEYRYKVKITDDILKRYPDVRYLCANYKVTNNGLKHVNLIELHMIDSNITNIKHMTNLKVLHACHTMMKTKSIIGLNLTRLDVANSIWIDDINHLTNLTHLNASWHCGLGDDGIKKLENLIELNVSYNLKITNVNHMQKLKKLVACCSGINDDGIKEINVVELNVNFNPYITSVKHMTNLKILHAAGEQSYQYKGGIDDNGIIGLDLTELNVCNNYKITNITHLKNLKKLDTGGRSGISREGIYDFELRKFIMKK